MTSTVRDPKIEELRCLVARLAGQRLPGERELAERMVISRPRVRSLLSTLAAEGLVHRRHGSGTYAIDRAAQSETVRRVGLWIDSDLKLAIDPFFSHVVECLQHEVQDAGAECSILRTDGQPLPYQGVDGIITLGTAGSHVIASWDARQPPVVGLFIADEIKAGLCTSILQIEDRQAGALAAQRLNELGLAHILFFGRTSIPVVQERLKGTRSELNGSKGTLDVIECALNYTAGFEAGRLVVLPRGKKTGAIAANDWLAFGLHVGLLSRGAALRQRVKIVSFDGLPLTNDMALGIESLAVPIEAMARDAVAELIRLRQKGAVGRMLHYPLSWREVRPEG